MGLDMSLFAKRNKRDAEQTYLTLAEEVEEKEIAYWRKHNALHYALYKLAKDKGVVQDDLSFNSIEFDLTEDDVKKCISMIENNELTPVSGFFFGTTDYDPSDSEYKDYDLKSFHKALEYIKNGYRVFYYPSW